MKAIDSGEPKKIVSFDGEWRYPLVKWGYDVTDHWDLSRSNVAFATEIFEHYIDVTSVRYERYPMYFATSLLIAIKLNEKNVLISDMMKYCRGHFGKRDMYDAEKDICERLRWKTFYPIPAQFIEIVGDYLQAQRWYQIDENHKSMVNAFLDLAIYQAEKSCFKGKGMRSRELATNNMIDAANSMVLSEGERTYLLNVIKKILCN